MRNANETKCMMQKEKNESGLKPNAATSGKKSGGLFLFSFFEPKRLLEALHRLADNYRISLVLPDQST